MKAEHLRIYKSVHTWTGIVSGMALFIAFYAGALTVFKEPIARWASPPAPSASPSAPLPRVPLAEAQTLIVRTLQSQPEAARDFTLHLQDTEDTPARMSWRVRPAGADEHDDDGVRHYTASLDAQGQARVHETRPSALPQLIDVLHRVVGLPVDNDPNRWVMGVVAVLYTLALVSGLIVLLPSLVKDLFALRVGKNLKRMWLDAHNVVGLFSLPFHLLMAITAVVFAFHDGIYALQDRWLHEGRMSAAFERPKSAAGATATRRDPATLRSPQELLATVQSLSPSLHPSHLQYQQVLGPKPVVRVWGHDEGAVSPRARGGFVAMDPYSGQVVNSDFLPGRQSTPHLIISSIFALHMASFGGDLVKWLYFLLGLAGAWLFYSGNLLWVESRRRRMGRAGTERPAQSRSVRWMAAATVGVCQGCVLGLSLTMVAAKALHGHVADLATWHSAVYYAAFFGALAWATCWGAARASVHLLWAAAAATLAIPLSSLVAWALPRTGWWVHDSAATLAVDATALLGALGLATMARATARRVRHGPTDSVWSAAAPGPLASPVSPTAEARSA